VSAYVGSAKNLKDLKGNHVTKRGCAVGVGVLEVGGARDEGQR